MISLIAAISENNCIGVDGDLPWNLPEDMKHFRDTTRGKPVIMGRKTWESIPEKYRPLPGRTNIVISRNTTYTLPEHVLLFDNVRDAVNSQSQEPEVMLIGGASIYKEGITFADRLYITYVHQTVDGDTFFPEIDTTIWKEVSRDDRDNLSFIIYERLESNISAK